MLVGLLALFGPASVEAGEFKGRVQGVVADSPAVVWIEGLSGDVPEHNTVVIRTDSGFQSYVELGFVGNHFVLRNEDHKLHNIHLYMQLGYQEAVSQRPLRLGATLYNMALPRAGMEAKRPIKFYHRYRDDTGFIEVISNTHPEKKTYILVFDHPFATVTEADGSFSIPNVPPGEHKVRFWRNSQVRNWGTVKIGGSQSTNVVIESE